MSKRLLWVALLALGCGGGSGQSGPVGEGGSAPLGEPTAGAAGSVVSSGGSDAGAGQATGGSAGEAPAVTGGGGQVPVGGSAGAEQGGSGGSEPEPTSGSGGSTVGGSGGAPQAGSGGSGGTESQPDPIMCSTDGWMDCNGIRDDGTAHLNPDDCETPRTDHDNCGECGKKCGLSQVCKTFGSPGAWTYGCGSP